MASRGSQASSATSIGSREVVVLLLAIFAIILSLSRGSHSTNTGKSQILAHVIAYVEGAYEFEGAYFMKFDQTKWDNKRHPKEDELLPPPLVVDIDGDGLNGTNIILAIYF
jgi:hypothetical protein